MSDLSWVAAALIACAVSLAAIFTLGLTDPKRSRSNRKPARHRAIIRYTLILCALLPGAWLVFESQSVAFLIWLGFATLSGWGVALGIAKFAASHKK